jgi:ATP-dependent protease ClpP protease subunit
MKRNQTIAVGLAPIGRPSPVALTPPRKLYSLEPSASFMAAARERATAARRAGRAGPQSLSIDIEGEINAALADSVDVQLAAAPHARRLTLFLDSFGGEVAAAKRIHRAIRKHPASSKQAVILDKCHSAAVIVAVAADYRKALPHASILMHRTERNPADRGRWTAAQYARNASDLQTIDDELLEVLAERTGGSRAALANEEANEKKTPLMKALGMGVIHEIEGVTPPLDPTFPDRIYAAMRDQRGMTLVGAPSRIFSPAYFAACRAAGRI